eukprot:TRINITY_DN847_c0_g1_i1.p1 TRINITY_DN847_c0_g1~~TRINITY_DN847_c0_g1_i1.p1  ORF type:complete len:420 (-),score=63.82 TRINITY_DN847_c0_g1_i1:2842-4101(-)
MLYSVITFLFIAVLGRVECGWKQGRGTFYGNEYWLWNIHEGSCGYGYLCPEEGTGWDITALPDVHWDYLNSCGRCYEVKCLPSVFTDNYGETLDRSGVCYDAESSVVVTVTDTCPCNYATNWYSNQRWCCGDMDHLDLSVWTFEKLADTKWGVIGLQYQEVPCNHKPTKPAPEPTQIFEPSPIPDGTTCPKGNFPLKEDWQYIQYKYRELYAAKGMSFANPSAIDYQEYSEWKNGAVQTSKLDSNVQLKYVEPKPTANKIFEDSVASNWKTTATHTEIVQKSGGGIQGGNSLCAAVQSGGVFDFSGPSGSLTGKISLELWVESGAGTPDVDVNVGGSSGFCSPIRLSDLYTSGSSDGFSRYDIYLGLFDPPRDIVELTRQPKPFNGCLDYSADQITTVRVRNNRLFDQTVCMDDVKLLG